MCYSIELFVLLSLYQDRAKFLVLGGGQQPGGAGGSLQLEVRSVHEQRGGHLSC